MEPLSKKGWVVAQSTFVSEIFHGINVPNQAPGGFLDGYLISTSQKWKAIPHHLLKPFDGGTSGVAGNFFQSPYIQCSPTSYFWRKESLHRHDCVEMESGESIFSSTHNTLLIDKSKSVLCKPDRTSVITAHLVTLQRMIFASVCFLLLDPSTEQLFKNKY